MSSSGVGEDRELQEFLAVEQQKAQLQQGVHRLHDICWDKCVTKPGSSLDSWTESCITNCVDRFYDTAALITRRFQEMVQRGSGGLQ